MNPPVRAPGLSVVRDQREALRSRHFGAEKAFRILFVGRFTYGPTDVVASLKRALEKVGHRVFYIDTSVHPDVLDNRFGVSAGFGPIFLRTEALRPVLDRFAPQVVVTCAGGIVVDEAGARELRDRGSILIGMTLSDPDVHESLVDHVGLFDYHTTNSLLAHSRYEEARLHNTFHFPFGIDSDFVLRSVPPDPSLRADVICIGHAGGRPDRQRVMTAMAEQFSVRVYGKGWPLADAAPIEGDRLLQAAREGTFHVNFPTSRAGYKNVKVGVFESIGAGGILCTNEFDELARLFTYGEEIIGYDDEIELASNVAALLADPESIGQIRNKAFHRLITEHLYEHRWLQLLESIEEDIQSVAPRIGTSRALEVGSILEHGESRPRTLLISGYFGARNLGDDLLLDAITTRIEGLIPDAQVVVAATNPKLVESALGIPAFKRTDHLASDYWASRATAVVLGPGGLLHDYTIRQADGVAGVVSGASVSPAHLAQLPLMTVAHGGSFHLFGLGVGPLEDESAKATIRLMGKIADSVVVRDSLSSRLLTDIPGFDATVQQAPDMAYSLDLSDIEPPDHGSYIAVNLRPWQLRDVGLAALAEVLREVADSREMNLIGVPMQPVDAKALEELFSEISIAGDLKILSGNAPRRQVIGVLGNAAAVVAMRLHANLLAHRLGVPAIGLVYDPKVDEHFKELRREAWAVRIPVDGDSLAWLIQTAIDRGLDQETMALVTDLESQATAAVTSLAEELGRLPIRHPVPGAIQQHISSSQQSATRRLPPGWL